MFRENCLNGSSTATLLRRGNILAHVDGPVGLGSLMDELMKRLCGE